MQANPQGRSATILTFPTARRAVALNLSNKARFAAELAALGNMPVASAEAWYHEAAMADDVRSGQPGREH